MRASDAYDELRRVVAGVVEQVFLADIGICAPALTDYLADLLLDFMHVDRIYRLRNVDGEIIRDISRARTEAYLGPGVSRTARQRIINRYIGDYTLFWTGLYPEALRPRRHYGVDRLHEYVLQGKRGYELASELSGDQDRPPAELLHELSAQFEACVEGLHLVRASWDELSGALRQN